MAELKESIVNSIKDLLLPEIKKLQEGQKELIIRQDAVEKQVVTIGEDIRENTRRIDNLYIELNKRFDEVNKRFDEVYKQFGEVHRRFEEIGKRFEETDGRFSNRFDALNMRIDYILVEFGNVRKEMERLKREEALTADILHRMEILEERVLLSR